MPNSQIFGQTIKNYSASDTRRIDLVVGVGYGDRGRRHELGDSSVNLVVRPWVKVEDCWNTPWDLTRALKEQLEAAGCSIPFPQRDVHLHQAG